MFDLFVSDSKVSSYFVFTHIVAGNELPFMS
jgi:hypothetical protein